MHVHSDAAHKYVFIMYMQMARGFSDRMEFLDTVYVSNVCVHRFGLTSCD